MYTSKDVCVHWTLYIPSKLRFRRDLVRVYASWNNSCWYKNVFLACIYGMGSVEILNYVGTIVFLNSPPVFYIKVAHKRETSGCWVSVQ